MHTVKQKLGSGNLICLFFYLCIFAFLYFCIFVFLYFRLVAGGCGGSGESDGAPGSHRWPQIITRIISIFTISTSSSSQSSQIITRIISIFNISTSNNIIVVPISSWVFNWSTAWVWFMYIVNMSWQNKVHSENFKSNGLTNMLGAILLLVQKVWSASWFTNQNDDTIVLMFVILIRGGVYGSIELNYWFRSHLPDSLPDELLVATTGSANVELKTSQECETLFVIFLSSCLDITLIKYLKDLKKVTQKIVPGTYRHSQAQPLWYSRCYCHLRNNLSLLK